MNSIMVGGNGIQKVKNFFTEKVADIYEKKTVFSHVRDVNLKRSICDDIYFFCPLHQFIHIGFSVVHAILYIAYS